MENDPSYDDGEILSWEDIVANIPGKVLIDFRPETVNDEVERRYVHYQSWQQPGNPRSRRVYTQSEQAVLPLPVRQYLATLEQQDILSPSQREWLLESVRAYAMIANWPEVPMVLVIATLFLIQGIEGVVTGQIPLTWRQRWPEGPQVH